MNRKRLNLLRAMYAINVLGAGIPGVLIVLFPKFSEQFVLWPKQDPATMAILGSIWLAIGVVSLFDLKQPIKFLPVFLIQFIYKTIWIISFVVPQWAAGTPPTGSQIIVVSIFVLLLVEFICILRPSDFSSND